MTGDGLLALVRAAAPHLLRADPEKERYQERLEERHDELHALVRAVAGRRARNRSGDLRDRLVLLVAARAHDRGPGAAGARLRDGRGRSRGRAQGARHDRVQARRPRDRRPLVSGAVRAGEIAGGDRRRVRRHGEGGPTPRRLRRGAPLGRARLRGRRRPRRSRGRPAPAAHAGSGGPDGRAIRRGARALSAQHRAQRAARQRRQRRRQNHNLVYVELHSGNREEAGRRFAVASEWIFANDNEYLRPYFFLDAGVLALHDGDDERAGRLVACADRIFRDTDSIPDPDDYVELEQAVAELRERLAERFDTVWEEGRALSEEAAQGLARGSG